ncbi:unnamed protein product [Owenia fusiformis]|uniref:Uncharacterized protein n=1 Tax=Owenia fusiformis TaxID=6347 RepID=A0A8J1XXG5_OWEFU|nr:unnamed protein product [Owenia fusiformis]
MYIFILIASNILAIVVVIYIFVIIPWLNRRKIHAEPAQVVGDVDGLDILKMINLRKILPVGLSSGWRLCGCVFGTRSWKKQLTNGTGVARNLRGTQDTSDLYAAFKTIHVSPQVVLNTIKDPTKIQQWNQDVVDITQVTIATSTQTKNEGPTEHGLPGIYSDSVGLECEIGSKGKHAHMYHTRFKRYWYREMNGCCWFLEVSNDNGEWAYYLAQPVQELNQCMLTVVMHPGCTRVPPLSDLPSSRLASLHDYLLHRRVQSTPLRTITLPSNIKQMQQTDSSKHSCKSVSKRELRDSNIILQYKEGVPSIAESTDSSSSSLDSMQHCNISNKSTKSNSLQSQNTKIQSKSSDILNTGSSPSNPDSNKERLNEQNPSARAIQQALRKLNISSDTQVQGANTRGGRGDVVPRGRSKSDTAVSQHKGLNTWTDDEVDEQRYRLLGNNGDGVVLEEVVHVSNIDVSKPWQQQAENTGGWVFCGIDKDVVVLKKLYEEGGPKQSYLGKGIVPVTPQILFDTIRNPRTRFTYDDMLKQLDVIHDFGNGLKILYCYFEVPQMFRKEGIDCYLLQSERVDNQRYILSLQSIDWPHDTQNNATRQPDTLRSTILPCGWLIESAVKKKTGRLQSMVTYFIQMELNDSKEGSGSVVEELVSKQPFAISQLRQYLAPSAYVSRSRSTSQEDV